MVRIYARTPDETEKHYHREAEKMGKFEKMCNEYRENKRLIEELTAMNDELKASILELMGERETVAEGACKATNITVVSSRFDSSGFKKVYPDLFSEYSRETSYKRFTVI